MIKDSRYDNYTQLLTKVDEMFAGVSRRHQGQFSCRSGCHGCCQAGLTFTNVEASSIREWLAANPDVAAKISDAAQMFGDNDFCAMLDREGRCSIYEVRPMICRSHGMPVSWEADDALQSGDLQGVESRDVCPLNFDGVDLSALPKTDVLSLDKLNIVLSLINRKFDEEKSGTRFSVEELIPR